jgi:APA family basic amino acid/polyamine antiporter
VVLLSSLNKSITLPQATIYGVGVIVGAGIYTLIGVAAGMTGPSLWLSFVLAGLIASLTAFSYAKLTELYPKEAAESVYVFEATKNKQLAFFIGFLSLITTLISTATVSWGFAAYFKVFFVGDPLLIAAGIILVLSLVNFRGIQESVTINNTMTFLSLIGLILIIVFGLRFIGSVNLFSGIDGKPLLENSFSLIPTIFSAAALIFFAYLGFEEIANVSEEMRNAKKNAPKAIIFSLLIATVLYILIAIVSVSVVPYFELSEASNPNISLLNGPLALVAEKAIAPGFGFWITIFALCAASSTIIVLLNVGSRILYGMSTEKLIPSCFSKINSKTKAPWLAILFMLEASMVFVAFGSIELLGKLSTLGVFFIFFAVNGSLVWIQLRKQKKPSLAALLGTAFCLFMFLTQYWEPISFFGFKMPLFIFGSLLFSLGFPFYWFLIRNKKTLEKPLSSIKNPIVVPGLNLYKKKK